MQYFLMSCWSTSDESLAAFVEIGNPLASRIKAMAAIISSKAAKKADLYEVTAFETSVVYFPESIASSTFENWNEDGENRLEISKSDFDALMEEIDEDSVVRTDADILYVSGTTFRWTGNFHFEGQEIETQSIAVSALI